MVGGCWEEPLSGPAALLAALGYHSQLVLPEIAAAFPRPALMMPTLVQSVLMYVIKIHDLVCCRCCAS